MRFKDKLRKYWHDFYYRVSFTPGITFALRCRDVAEHIDLEKKEGVARSLRVILHLSLCQACANYAAVSRGLGKAMRNLLQSETDLGRMQKLKDRLLKKYRLENR